MSRILARRLNQTLSFKGCKLLASSHKSALYSSDNFCPFITTESDPKNHTLKHVGQFYNMENSFSLNFLYKGVTFNDFFVEECKTFKKTPILIRKPAVEIINYLNNTDFNSPINKYVLFGKRGNGVTTVTLHLVHYAYSSGWLIVHLPNIINMLTSKTERCESATRKGMIDLPIKGSEWLVHFKTQNQKLIEQLDLKLANDYVWNTQEENKKGDSLLSLLNHGIARGKYSCDVIIGLLDEIKEYSRKGLVKTLVVIDNYSILFHPARKSTNHKYKNLGPSQVSFMESFKNMAKPDWHNGAVILSCHTEKFIASDTDHLPLNKLTEKGFEFLDPFIPIEVPKLTDSEMTNLLEFYRSEKWLSTTSGDSELKILSSGSIATLKRLCGGYY